MYIIEAGAITALLLTGMCLSILIFVPLAAALKRWLCVGPGKISSDKAETMPAWRLWVANAAYNVSRWTHFLLHVALIIGIYWFMGVTVTAHISVIAFELLWQFVVGPLYAWFLTVHPQVRERRRDVRRFAVVA